MTRVLVTGPREYVDRDFVWSKLAEMHAVDPIETLIHGDCETGADHFADEWAKQHGIPTETYPAMWSMIDGLPRNKVSIGVRRDRRPYNKLAGFNRNTEMLRLGCPTHVAAFVYPEFGRTTPGTSDMLSKARTAQRNGAAFEIEVFRPPLAEQSRAA